MRPLLALRAVHKARFRTLQMGVAVELVAFWISCGGSGSESKGTGQWLMDGG